jgi:Phage gp6-like head-tail connector protein
MTYDLGDVVPLGITITDSTGANANASAVTCTIYQPDGTTVTGSVTNPSTGLYNVDFSPSQSGRHAVKWVATGTNASAYSDDFVVRDFTELGIVSLQDVKTHLNIPSTSTTDDEELRSFIDAASDLAESYVGQVLGRRTFTAELYDGGADCIRIRNPKAISITSVYENGALVASSGYALDYTGQRLYRVGSSTLYATNSYGYWTAGFNNISVTYVAGYVNPPMAAKQGVLEIVRHLWQTQRGSMSVLGRTLAGDELTPATTGAGYSLPRRAMELLDPTSFPGMA